MEDFGKNWLLHNQFLDETAKSDIEKIVKDLTKKQRNQTTGQIIANTNFGFWSSLFGNKYNLIWQQQKRIPRVFIRGYIFNVKDVKK